MKSNRTIVLLLFAMTTTSLLACDSPADDIPGTYRGDLTRNDSYSRATNIQPNDEGATADVTHFSGGDTQTGAEVVVIALGDASGRPRFSAQLAPFCTVQFEWDDDRGFIVNVPDDSGCQCSPTTPAGSTLVTGNFKDWLLHLDASVSMQGSGTEYAGGCSFRFVSAP